MSVQTSILSNQERPKGQGRTGTWELHLGTRRLECSTGFKQLFGLSDAEPLDFSGLASLLHTEDWTRLTDAIDRCGEFGTDLGIEVRLAGTGGNHRWIELRAELQHAADGGAWRLTGVALDATERLKAQQEMHRTALLLQAVLETASGLIYAKDLEGRMLIANPPTLELIGRTWQEIKGRTDVEFLSDAAQGAAVMANDRRIMDRGCEEVLEEHVGSANQPVRTFLSTKTPLRDEAGNIIGLVGVSQDITDRKAAERKLLDLNETLEARVAERTRERDSAWNRSQDLLLVLDGKGIFKAVNPAWTTVLGWERNELLERNILDFIHPDDHPGTNGALTRAVSAQIAKHENRYRHKDGTYRWIEWSAAPEGDRIHASGRHVTAQKEAEMVLAEKTAQLEISNKELESFSYSISHDLRAPLRAIDGFGLMLEEDHAERLSNEGRRLLTTIRQNSQRMGQLIDNLLAFSRLCHAPLASAEVDVDSMVREIIAEIAPGIHKKSVTFDVDRLPATYGDRGLLRQVWTNLLSNAVKYSANEPSPRVEIRSRIDAAEVIYSIRDNGVGFDMKYADKLFGVFQRLHTATEFSGNGVGLAIVQRIVTRHGGRIWANGVLEQGAVFSFALPIQYSSASANAGDQTCGYSSQGPRAS
jgi:PAS domain S-box-containing protein